MTLHINEELHTESASIAADQKCYIISGQVTTI